MEFVVDRFFYADVCHVSISGFTIYFAYCLECDMLCGDVVSADKDKVTILARSHNYYAHGI